MGEPYYLRNFQTVLSDVEGRYGDLLTPDEAARLAGFRELDPEARMLFVRLLTRKGPWIRRDALAYAEIGDLPGALGRLEAAGLCQTETGATPADLTALLRRDELAARLRAAGLPCPARASRDALADQLLASAPEAAGLPAVALRDRAWADLALLLFFGNREQGLADFVMADLGHVRYEAYPLDPAGRAFRTRAEVEALCSLEALRDALEAGEDLAGPTGALLAMEACPGLRAGRRHRRLLNEAGRAWERLGREEAALACYGRSGLPPARERVARIHLAAARWPEAAEAALAMARAPLDPGEARAARRILARLARHEPAAAAWLAAHPPPPAPAELRLTVPRHPSGLPEQAALAAAPDWRGWHTENVLWNALFGLAFWDVVFAPVPGAFFHPFQAGPADLRSPAFAEARRELLAARLERLSDPAEARRLILGALAAKRGTANPFVAWKALPDEVVAAALDTVPHGALLAVLGTMAPQPSAWRSGFPDLFLCREGQCMLWEVKGPGDTLRPEQERWLGIFAAAGVDARVVRVQYADGEDA
ncbi:VRR-NUC domain-containing protein [Mesoterricola sediminis]|uniref:phosphodiesterase I n=1 Tax=Mesoterricola sediminis TaxID=2927980 RepID=A0AA48GYR8_9BACT|nr:VRR-NUC domain-containing protein [Mesoterricola sediminis]BDU78100.1 hypothetical protein METESE_30580 [Mesoterricola sediminis]